MGNVQVPHARCGMQTAAAMRQAAPQISAFHNAGASTYVFPNRPSPFVNMAEPIATKYCLVY